MKLRYCFLVVFTIFLILPMSTLGVTFFPSGQTDQINSGISFFEDWENGTSSWHIECSYNLYEWEIKNLDGNNLLYHCYSWDYLDHTTDNWFICDIIEVNLDDDFIIDFSGNGYDPYMTWGCGLMYQDNTFAYAMGLCDMLTDCFYVFNQELNSTFYRASFNHITINKTGSHFSCSIQSNLELEFDYEITGTYKIGLLSRGIYGGISEAYYDDIEINGTGVVSPRPIPRLSILQGYVLVIIITPMALIIVIRVRSRKS